jgi:reverse gyrase
MYASYQGNSATYLAGLLVDEEAKRNQLEQLLVKHLAGLESKDPQTKADAIREITLFVRTYIYAPDPDPETEKRAFDDIIAKAKKRQS